MYHLKQNQLKNGCGIRNKDINGYFRIIITFDVKDQ